MLSEDGLTYTTVSGDTWDAIAFRALDDELQTYPMIQANPLYQDVVIFDAGVALTVPVLAPNTTLPNGLPPWRLP